MRSARRGDCGNKKGEFHFVISKGGGARPYQRGGACYGSVYKGRKLILTGGGAFLPFRRKKRACVCKGGWGLVCLRRGPCSNGGRTILGPKRGRGKRRGFVKKSVHPRGLMVNREKSGLRRRRTATLNNRLPTEREKTSTKSWQSAVPKKRSRPHKREERTTISRGKGPSLYKPW